MIDLHVHSVYSDGTLTPSELVDYAMKKGISAFALTDHDTTDGIDEAMTRARELKAAEKADQAFTQATPENGEQKDAHAVPEIIPGIELSTDEGGKEVHIVGLFIDKDNPEFREYLKAFIETRDNRNKKMCDRFQEHGIDVTYEALLERFPDCVLTRAHFARYLTEHGYVKSNQEAFDRYLGSRCPMYVPREKITPVKAVELIKTAGGLPIFAHPILCRMSDSRLEALVMELKEAGLVGIEAIYSTYAPAEERQIRSLAAKYDLLISGGSDFHGANKPKIDMGTGMGKLYVPEEVLQALKERRPEA
ncbi:MAG: PHP domain-containing protein [Lachnospiraceae bacterium]|nr:PHP domain-containing protein [Lachnospiraceae bacterium]